MTGSGEDFRLVAGLTAGTAGATEAVLERIYRRYGSAVFGFVAWCTGDSLFADDVVEEVFLHLWRQPQSFGASVGSLRSHLVKDGYRRLRERGWLEPSKHVEGGHPNSDEADSGPAFEELPTKGQGAGWQALQADERLAIGLVRFGEMITLEVAEFLGVDQNIVGSWLTRGLHGFAGGSGATAR